MAKQDKARISIHGNLGRDAELKALPSGDPVLEFSLAVNDRNDKTTWYRCSLFGQRSPKVAQYLTKGKRLEVEGDLTLREYESNGSTRTSPDVRVSEFYFLGGSGEAEGNGGSQRQAQAASTSVDELPF